VAALGDLVSAVDVAALTGDFAAYVAASFRQAVTNGIWGWFDDDLAFTRPWGFDLHAIAAPVSIWYGTQDVLAPRAHSDYLIATIPGASRNELVGGHVLSDDDVASIYQWLTDAGTGVSTGWR